MSRIITHAECMDGYCSAFLFKKYLADEFGVKITDVIGVQPREIQENSFVFEDDDVLLDLPRPSSKILLWFDHHKSNQKESYEDNEFWKQTASCSSLIIDIAKEKGVTLPENIDEFREAIDKADDAQYTPEDVKQCYYLQESYEDPSMLQRVHMVKAVIHTRDYYLNQELLQFILEQELKSLPVEIPFDPLPFFIARVKAMEEWRTGVSTYLEYDEESKTVIQDDRRGKARGAVDHFYAFMHYPQTSYNLLIKPISEDATLLRVGSNIFDKKRCKVDIGKTCHETGKKFGEGSGGGHYGVGGCTVKAENTDAAKKFILEKLTTSEQ